MLNGEIWAGSTDSAVHKNNLTGNVVNYRAAVSCRLYFLNVHIQCCQLISDSHVFTVSQASHIFKIVWNVENKTVFYVCAVLFLFF